MFNQEIFNEILSEYTCSRLAAMNKVQRLWFLKKIKQIPSNPPAELEFTVVTADTMLNVINNIANEALTK